MAMDDRREIIRAELESARAEMLALIDSLRPADLDQPTHNGYSNVHATLAHLASAEAGRLLLTRVCRMITPLPLPTFFVDMFNALNVGARKRKSLDDFKRELEQSRAVTLRYLDHLSDAALARVVRDPIYGRLPLDQILILGHAGHARAHLAEIRQALGR